MSDTTKERIKPSKRLKIFFYAALGFVLLIAMIAIFAPKPTTLNHPRFRDFSGARVDQIRAALVQQSDPITIVEAENDSLIAVHNRMPEKLQALAKDNNYDALILLSPTTNGVRATVSTSFDDEAKSGDMSTVWLDNIGHKIASQ